jgi:beta-N-acetylhexosaminidase
MTSNPSGSGPRLAATPASRPAATPAPGPDSSAALAGVRFLRSFDGLEAGPEILAAVRAGRTSGFTLFRARNVSSPEQLRELCAELQAARPAGYPPLVIGIDQEGGQLQALGEWSTGWPGNLALGATGSEALTRKAGRAIGAEVAAVGGTLNFAPVCDVLQRASATPMGTRPFGDDPTHAAKLAAAMTTGLQEAGIAACLKHFPGHGSAVGDSHFGLPVVKHDVDELRSMELPPFEAGIAAGALSVMPGHLGVPALTGGKVVAATVSREILEGLLRRDLGFDGVSISDALDMKGAASGGGLTETVVATADAGMDLLMLNHPTATEEAAYEALRKAIAAGRIDPRRLSLSRDRIIRMRSGFASLGQPDLDVVGCAEHRGLAREIAEASVTLVRDPNGLLPLRLSPGDRVALIAPELTDLTPAETSSYLRLGLADALRDRQVAVDEFEFHQQATPVEAAQLAAATASHAIRIVCTFDALSSSGRAALAPLLSADAARATIAVALRSPYDLSLFPDEVASICTYGVQPPQIQALADGLMGRILFTGRLPIHLEAGS